MVNLAPLPFHLQLRDYLKDEHPGLWQGFCTPARQQAVDDNIRLHLLKETVNLSADSYPELYAMVLSVRDALGIELTVDLWQGPESDGMNAALFFLPDQVHVVFFGAIQDKLTPQELRSVVAHEMSHHLLYAYDDGDLYRCSQILDLLVRNEAHPSAPSTLRSFQLATEVVCDRGSLLAGATVQDAVSALVKVRTGLTKVSATDYLDQSAEVLKQVRQSEQWTHPEPYIRAYALSRFADDGHGSDQPIGRLLFGLRPLEELDWVQAQTLRDHLKLLFDAALGTPWMQTSAHLAHAKMFFEDYEVAQGAIEREELKTTLSHWHQSIKDYLGYVLLDFVTVEPDQQDASLTCMLALARDVGLTKPFIDATAKELKMTKTSLKERLLSVDALMEQLAQGVPTQEGQDGA